jgi:hypothetical protein
MKYAVKVGSGAVIYIPNFLKTDSSIKKLMSGEHKTYREHGDRMHWRSNQNWFAVDREMTIEVLSKSELASLRVKFLYSF